MRIERTPLTTIENLTTLERETGYLVGGVVDKLARAHLMRGDAPAALAALARSLSGVDADAAARRRWVELAPDTYLASSFLAEPSSKLAQRVKEILECDAAVLGTRPITIAGGGPQEEKLRDLSVRLPALATTAFAYVLAGQDAPPRTSGEHITVLAEADAFDSAMLHDELASATDIEPKFRDREADIAWLQRAVVFAKAVAAAADGSPSDLRKALEVYGFGVAGNWESFPGLPWIALVRSAQPRFAMTPQDLTSWADPIAKFALVDKR